MKHSHTRRCRCNRSTQLALFLSCLLVTQSWVQAQTASLLTDHYTYLPSEAISVSFQGGPGNRLDWIGIYPEGVEPGSTPSTMWFYVDNTQNGNTGLSEGTVTFPSGLNLAGNYVAFLLLNDGYTKLAETTLRIIDPGESYVRSAKPVYGPGEVIQIGFTNAPGNPKDWVGIYPEGREPGDGNSLLWAYVDGTQTGSAGQTQGELLFTLGLNQPGKYFAYLLYDDGYTVLAREPFEVRELTTTPRLLSVRPASNAQDVSPDIDLLALITNGVSHVVASSVELFVNDSKVQHQYGEEGGLVQISYRAENLLPSASDNSYRLVFRDNATPANAFTNLGTFTILAYSNLVLPAPVHFENFDSTPEGQLPVGWHSESYSTITDENFDLQNLNSKSYADWVVVESGRFAQEFLSYEAQEPTDDYQRVLSVSPANVVNGQILRNLAQNHIVFGNSGYRSGESQYLILHSPDFDLSGKTNVHLSFHSIWEQNQDSIATVEYSIDEGETWLPIVYMIHNADIIRDENEEIDAVSTLTTLYGDLAMYMDPVTFEQKGGTYGAYIGAEVSAELAPFIRGRMDDNPIESKRVEFFRLPAADNQSKVRFRFAHSGTDSWYFGIDNFGLYSIGTDSIDQVSLAISKIGNSLVISWPAEAVGYTLQSTASLSNLDWTAVPGVVNHSIEIQIGSGPAFFRLAK